MKGVEATATLNTSGSVDATCEATDLLTKGLVAKLEALGMRGEMLRRKKVPGELLSIWKFTKR